MAFFDYVNTPAADWDSHLRALQQKDPKGISVRIYWGDHESIRGTKDFHSKPRLKIEKLCLLAGALKLPLHFVFGFDNEKRSFPDWAHALSPKALIPVIDKSALLSPREYVQTPSLRNTEIFSGFLSFVEEAVAVLSLYKAPEGAVKSVSFSWGALEADTYQLDGADWVNHLIERFQTIKNLNLLFQTSFNDFTAFSKPSALKTMLMKRPWLACWEYKNYRKKIFQIWEIQVKQLFDRAGLSINLDQIGDVPRGPLEVIIDDTFLETSRYSDGISPLFIRGELDSNVVRGFRVAERVKLEVKRHKDSLWWLSEWHPVESSNRCVLICHKFLPRNTFRLLEEFTEKGGKVWFPFGVPSWDENLESLNWKIKNASPMENWATDDGFYLKMRAWAT